MLMCMEAVKLDIENLDQEIKNTYALMTEPKYRLCLNGKDPNDINTAQIFCIGLENNSKPIGLALISFYEALNQAEIHTINIDKHYKNPKNLTFFLHQIENIIFSANECLLIYRFSDTDPMTEDIVPILDKQEWEGPKLKMLRYFYDAKTFNPPWYNRLPPLPPGYFEFFWPQIKKNELTQIKMDGTQGHFTTHVSPMYDKDRIEPINSIGLRHKKQVIGWMICHRVAPDTIRYTAFYIKPEFTFRGYQIRLLADSIQKQQKSDVKWALFELSLEGTPVSWINFVLKRLAPFAQATVEVYEAWKAPPGCNYTETT